MQRAHRTQASSLIDQLVVTVSARFGQTAAHVAQSVQAVESTVTVPLRFVKFCKKLAILNYFLIVFYQGTLLI
jgi:hypothetical protein